MSGTGMVGETTAQVKCISPLSIFALSKEQLNRNSYSVYVIIILCILLSVKGLCVLACGSERDPSGYVTIYRSDHNILYVRATDRVYCQWRF